MEDSSSSTNHQILVKMLDGKHRVVNLGPTPSISVPSLKLLLHSLTSIPSHLILLLNPNPNPDSSPRILHDHQTLTLTLKHSSIGTEDGRRGFPVVIHLLLRLRGGKGGFGSLLRGAATKAGQKKTNNFDACRDMSGRRLRHVNAEKKLEEWRAEAEERRLEKMAEEFLKKKTKESGRRKSGGDGAEKYVAKYREDSAKCMEEVERSVRESVLKKKRRMEGSRGAQSDSKRLHIWMGKRKVGDSESEDTDEEDSDEDKSEENEKSVVIDNGNHSDSSPEIEGSSDSIAGKKLDSTSLDRGSFESGSEEEGTAANGSSESSETLDGCSDDNKGKSSHDPVVESPENMEQNGVDTEIANNPSPQPRVSSSVEEVASSAEARSCVASESVPQGANVQDLGKPLNFDDYNSAAELEVLGLERLKSELQARGLKCGGTLQERAARLFLLKTTPLEKLPKKLLSKK